MTSINSYYKIDTSRLIKFLIPVGSKITVINDWRTTLFGNYDYIVLENLVGDLKDVQIYLTKIKKNLSDKGRILITYYNHLWEPILKLASTLGLRKVKHEQNWLNNKDIINLLELSGYDVVTHQRRLLLPINLPLVSPLFNRWLAHLPIINSFCLTTWVVAKLKSKKVSEYSVSIVVPARNEEGNISKVVRSIPRFGKEQEIIFVEGGSSDHTWSAISNLKFLISKQIPMSKNPIFKRTIKSYKQEGKGKADAVRLGFNKASGDILMILDADLTVNPKDLTKFYEALSEGKGEFINGSRLVYPMEKQAMRTLNKLGNKIFSWLFTWILGQSFKDTLCGTKALFKSDYQWINKNGEHLGKLDPFGDFDLIFGAIKKNLKVVEIPVRYRQRSYGSTNISRFKHGFQLFLMTIVAFKKFKAW